MKTEFLELIQTRRSCRKYQAQQITDEELKAVLEAGTYAPTSRGLPCSKPARMHPLRADCKHPTS